ncbi:MAG: DNA replication and repair protein RecF [Chitinophagales bacterium]
MYLKAISLIQFKNYGSAQFEFSPSLNFFTGQNGAGKTNLLDGIHYLCLGKSYFHTSDQQGIQHQAAFFRMEGKFLQEPEEIQVNCVYAGGGRKELSKNGVIYQRLTDHVGNIPVVMIAPDDHSLINEGSDERRRFIDNTISQIDHPYLEDLVGYNKVLQQRNAALKGFAMRRIFDAGLIEAFNQQLVTFGEKIFQKRRFYLQKMAPLIKSFYAMICEEKESITTEYQSVLQQRDFMGALQASLEKDRQLERTTEGIHRDEFEFCLDQQPIKRFGSQGQKKTFLMSLKLAQWELIKSEKSKTPILLLDDLFDKLDENRSKKILDLVAADSFGQVFITDTSVSRLVKPLASIKKEYRNIKIGG